MYKPYDTVLAAVKSEYQTRTSLNQKSASLKYKLKMIIALLLI